MSHNWILKLNESNSRIFKEDVIKQALEAALLGATDADEFLCLAWYAYNPFNVYNLTRISKTTGIVNQDNDIVAFINLLHDLQSRKITGNAAIAHVERVSQGYNSDLWNTFLMPVILKDLRVGATIKTFNKILKKTKYEIPIFECQLATDSAKHPKKLSGEKILESKLDGIRALAIVDISFLDKVTVTLHSRNGKLLNNFPDICDQLTGCVHLFKDAPWNLNKVRKFVLDGEIISENFQALMKQAQRKTNVDTASAVYSIFDIIPFENFDQGRWVVNQSNRIAGWLAPVRDKINANYANLHILSGIEVDLDTEEGHATMRKFADEQVAMGYEGIMIKDVAAPYKCKRGTAWMKWKPTISVDLELIDMEEGTGRNTGRLGALVCEGEDDGKLIRVNVGGGLSDSQRDDFWARRDELIGFIVEVKADVVTQNENGTYSLRFPRLVGFRGLEVGEKI